MNTDRKVESVRKIDQAKAESFKNNQSLFRNYMKGLSKKVNKPLVKIANVYVPFSLGTIATAAGCSFLAYNNDEMTLHEMLNMIGQTVAINAAGALGLTLATITAVSATESIKFINGYTKYPKNIEQLKRLGVYNQLQEKKASLETKQEVSHSKGGHK